MSCLIIAESYNADKVRAFGARLLANPLQALALADALVRGAPFTGTAAEVVRDFDRMTPWEKSGALDELRDVLDKLLGGKFWEYVKAARAVDNTEVKA